MLLDAYLLNPKEEWEATVERPFLALRLLHSWEPELEPQQKIKGSSGRAESRRIGAVGAKQLGLSSLVIAYATLGYALSREGGNRPAGRVKLSTLLYKSWSAPAIRLRFSEFQLEEAVDYLKQQGLLQGLTLDYLPDEGSAMMIWTRALLDIQEEIWKNITECETDND